jgi:catechol 2,3-dioxygenase-like lactoylglutathione lyase family enzyme
MTAPFSPGTTAMRCRDMAACIRFYRLLLGDEVASLTGQDQTGTPWHTAWFALRDGGRFALTDDRSHTHPPVGRGCAHLLCDDPAGEEARLRAIGITALMSTHETKSGYALVLADPDGNEIVISTPETLPGLVTTLPF